MVHKKIPHKLRIITLRACVNYFEAACMIQTKMGAQQDFKHLIQVSLYFHSKEPLKKSTKHNLIANIF